MWMWILIGLNIITKANGYASGKFPQSCESMAPMHRKPHKPTFAAQTNECPFKVDYTHGEEGEPITVFLNSKTNTPFKGFMLEARKTDKVDEGHPVGRFIEFEHKIQPLTCSGLKESAVSQINNQEKTLIKVNWTAEGEVGDITFRATFIQSFELFWEQVDVSLPLYTTSTTKPSTTSTTKPSTTTSTTNPSATTSIATPSATTTTTNPSATASTTKPNTTSTTKPSTTTSTQNNGDKPEGEVGDITFRGTFVQFHEICWERVDVNDTDNTICVIFHRCVATSLTAIHSVLTMAKPHIPIFTFYISPSSQRLNMVLKRCCSVLCTVVGILALVLFSVGDSFKVILVSLVFVVIMIDVIELACLPIRPSHELEEIIVLPLNVCSVISEIFTVAVIFIGVLEIEDCRNCRRELWLLIVMFAYTVWIFLFGIWVFLLSTHLRGILGRSIIGEQRKKEKLSAAKVIVTALSMILVIGAMFFAAAITVGIFRCQKK